MFIYQSMLQKLPMDVQKLIYNKCEIADRVKLRMASPKQYGKQLSPHEKKLKLLHICMKTCPKKKLSRTITRFLEDNKTDPTVKSFCKVVDYPLTEEDLHTGVRMANLINDIVRKRDFDFTRYPDFKDMSANDIKEFEEAIGRYNITPEMLQALESNENTQKLLTHIFEIEYKRAIFNIVNYGRELILKHVMENTNTYSFDREECRHYMLNFVECFVSRKICRNIMIDYFHPEPVHYEKMKEKAIDEMDHEALEDLLNRAP